MFITKQELNKIKEQEKQKYKEELLTQLDDYEIKRAIYLDDLIKENKELKEQNDRYKLIIKSFEVIRRFLWEK